MFVTTRMQKTKQIVHNPISDEAYGLLGNGMKGLSSKDSRIRCCRVPKTLAVGGRHNQENNLPLYPAFVCGSLHVRGNGYGHGCHTSLYGTQEHYHHTDLFQDGGTADVRGRGQDNPETQGGIRHPSKSGIFRGSGYCVEL